MSNQPPAPPIRVLIIDDDVEYAEMLQEAFHSDRGWGF